MHSDEETQPSEKGVVCESESGPEVSETQVASTLSVIEPQPVILNLSQSEKREVASTETKPVEEELVTSTETIVQQSEVSSEDVFKEKKDEPIKLKVEAKEDYKLIIEADKCEVEEIQSKPDLSGLELLSNSIAEFETREIQKTASPIHENSQCIDHENSELDGLGLLCALAEKRFREEVDIKQEKEDNKEVKFDELEHNDIDNITVNNEEYDVPEPSLLVYEEKLAELKRQYKETLEEMTRLKPTDSQKYSISKDPSKIKDLASASLATEVLKTPSPCSSVSSSKKRKVGRPKKLSSGHGKRVTTETIFAKKPKTKGGIVGYLLSGKSTLSKGGIIYTKSNPHSDEEDTQEQPIIKVANKDKDVCVKIDEIDAEVPNEQEIKEQRRKERRERKHKSKKSKEKRRQMKASKKAEPVLKCALTDKHLEQDGLRVLCAMGGLFYAGRLSAVEAPDVYAVTLDGERGNRPHILSREEIMRDAVNYFYVYIFFLFI